jgi:hypothetical protein
MKTIEVNLPDEVFGVLSSIAKKQDEFVLDAIREKIERESSFEDELSELENGDTGNGLRPFGLSKGEFVVPDDFDEPLPEEVLRDFEGR